MSTRKPTTKRRPRPAPALPASHRRALAALERSGEQLDRARGAVPEAAGRLWLAAQRVLAAWGTLLRGDTLPEVPSREAREELESFEAELAMRPVEPSSAPAKPGPRRPRRAA